MGRLQGRSGRLRRARRMYVAYRTPNPPRRGCTRSPMHNATHARRNASRVRLRRLRAASIMPRGRHTSMSTPRCTCHRRMRHGSRPRLGTPAGRPHTASHGPNLGRIAVALPALACNIFGNETAPLDTACTNHMRNSASGFTHVLPDDTKFCFGSQSCVATSRGT